MMRQSHISLMGRIVRAVYNSHDGRALVHTSPPESVGLMPEQNKVIHVQQHPEKKSLAENIIQKFGKGAANIYQELLKLSSVIWLRVLKYVISRLVTYSAFPFIDIYILLANNQEIETLRDLCFNAACEDATKITQN